jgi:hypothetical protein
MAYPKLLLLIMILAVTSPFTAVASLINDRVDITAIDITTSTNLIDADQVLVGAGTEAMFENNGGRINVNVSSNAIQILIFGFTPNIFVVDMPAISWEFESLDWHNDPSGVITSVTPLFTNSGAPALTNLSFSDHGI